VLSTTFAVLLALAHVIAASKTTTTAKDFTAGDFMCPHFCVYARCRWSAWEAVMWVTESTFQPKRIAGDKKSPKLGKQSVRPHGGYEAGPVSCLYRKSDSAIVVMKSEVEGE
jgi:hypothetical protein